MDWAGNCDDTAGAPGRGACGGALTPDSTEPEEARVARRDNPSGELVAELDCEDADCDFCTAAELDAGTPTCADARPLQEYVWLDGAPIALLESDVAWTGARDDTDFKVKNIHVGLLGEPRRVTNAAGDVVWGREIAPFGYEGEPGEQRYEVAGDPTSLQLGLPGQYYEPEYVHYNWHRTYDAGLGQYWSADPLLTGLFGPGFDGIMQTEASAGQPVSPPDVIASTRVDAFAYAGSAPTAKSDPLGLNPAGALGAGAATWCRARPDACAQAIESLLALAGGVVTAVCAAAVSTPCASSAKCVCKCSSTPTSTPVERPLVSLVPPATEQGCVLKCAVMCTNRRQWPRGGTCQ